MKEDVKKNPQNYTAWFEFILEKDLKVLL